MASSAFNRWSMRSTVSVALFGVLALIALCDWFPPSITGAPLLPIFSSGHVLGTDAQGYDLFRLCLHYTRNTMLIGLAASAGAVAIGCAVGIFSAIVRGPAESITLRLMESLGAFPVFVAVLVIQGLLPKPSMLSLILALMVTSWVETARIARTEVRRVISSDYVAASRALGANRRDVIYRQVMPHLAPTIFGAWVVAWSGVTVIETLVSFFGASFGTHATTWGGVLAGWLSPQHSLGMLVGPVLFLAIFLLAVQTSRYRMFFELRH